MTRTPDYYEQPNIIELIGMAPNPFSEQIRMMVKARVAAELTLDIYNVAGEIIFTKNYGLNAGYNQVLWDGINEVGARCSSGIYIFHARAVGQGQISG